MPHPSPLAPEELCRRLATGEIVVMDDVAWATLEPSFVLVAQEDTAVSGYIAIFEGPCGVFVLEEPQREQRVARPLASVEAARELVRQRLVTYERMWDGCGCKIEYLQGDEVTITAGKPR
jgi:hypothetical protein